MPGSRILIVDDEKVIADSLALILAREGYETRTAYSAEQALKVVAEWEPALAIVDVVLPSMNGIDLAISLKQSNPSVLVLMISGQAVAGTLMDDAEKSGHTFKILAKPFPVPELLFTTSRLLATA